MAQRLPERVVQKDADLLSFDDPIAFRYLSETRDRDQPAPALIVRTGQADARPLPCGLLRAGRQLQGGLPSVDRKQQSDYHPVIAQSFVPCELTVMLTSSFPEIDDLRHMVGEIGEGLSPDEILAICIRFNVQQEIF